MCLNPSAPGLRRVSAGTQGSKHLIDEVMSLSMETSLGNSDTQQPVFQGKILSCVLAARCHHMSEAFS